MSKTAKGKTSPKTVARAASASKKPVAVVAVSKTAATKRPTSPKKKAIKKAQLNKILLALGSNYSLEELCELTSEMIREDSEQEKQKAQPARFAVPAKRASKKKAAEEEDPIEEVSVNASMSEEEKVVEVKEETSRRKGK
jgi:hypothetical protein